MTTDPRIVEVLHEGTRCYQVLAPDGHAPDLAELQELAKATGSSGRWCVLLLLDESPLRDHAHPEDGHTPDLSALPDELPAGAPLVLANELSLTIGVITGVSLLEPGSYPETTGRFLVAIARLHESPLARAVWSAMATILDSGCAIFTGRLDAGRAAWGDLARVNLVPRRDNACAAARLLCRWEDPKPGEVDLASWQESTWAPGQP